MTFLSIMKEEAKNIAGIFATKDDKAFPVWFAQVAPDLDLEDADDALISKHLYV